MSYYVIRGPLPNVSHYLCVLDSFPNPQWWKKEAAIRFPDARSARTWLYAAQQTWRDHGSYDGRVVRINTSADLKAERLRLRANAAALRERTRKAVLDEVKHAIMNGPIIRGDASARTLNDVMAAVRALPAASPVCDVCGEAEGERVASQVEVCRLCYMAVEYGVATLKDRVSDLENAIRAYAASDDEDRVREFDVMVGLVRPPATCGCGDSTCNDCAGAPRPSPPSSKQRGSK